MIWRGDVVLFVLPGDYGKPRPAVVAQSDLFNSTHASIVVCPLTTHLINSPLFRLSVSPSEANGLAAESQVMVDKLTAIRTERIRDTVGHLETRYTANLDEALRLWYEPLTRFFAIHRPDCFRDLAPTPKDISVAPRDWHSEGSRFEAGLRYAANGRSRTDPGLTGPRDIHSRAG